MSKSNAERNLLLFVAPIILLSQPLLASAADPSSLELVQTIPLKGKPGKLDHVALDAKRERLFLANKSNDTLDIIDLKAGKLLKQIPDQQAVQGLAYAADLDRVCAALGGGALNIFDGEKYELLKSIKFLDEADSMAYHPASHSIFVVHEKAIAVVDAKAMTLKTDVKIPAAAEGLQYELKRPRIYANIPSPSQVAVIDTEKYEVATTYPVKMAEGGHPLVLDEANHRLYVGCHKPPMLVVMDSETGKELSNVALPPGIDDLWMDAAHKRLIASCDQGFLVLLRIADNDRLEVIEKVPTAKGARTSVFAPEKNLLYLAVPRQEGKEGPEIRVYKLDCK